MGNETWVWEIEEWFKIKIQQIHLVLRSPQQSSCEVQKHRPLELPLQQPYKAHSSNPLQHLRANTYSTSAFVYNSDQL